MEKDTSVIPKGDYCYKIKKVNGDGYLDIDKCPYFISKFYNGVEQPYCSLLEKGSLANGTSKEEFEKLIEHFGSEDAVFEGLPLFLLWDMVKECNENHYTDQELEEQWREFDKKDVENEL